MIHIYCNVPTKGMEKESESLGIPLNEIVLLHNIIMSLRNNPNYHPSTTELKNLYNSNSIELKMYRYAIPYYNVGRVVTPNESLIERDSNNNLILNTVNTNIPIEKYLTQLPKEAMQDITTRKELYTVLLWMENLKNTKNLSIEDSYKEAIKLLNEYKKLDPSYFEVSKPYKEVESFDNNNQLASTKLVNGQIETTIKKVITPEEFYNYIQGKIESNTSKQKELVLKEMEKLGITLDKIKEVLNTSEKIKQFIYLHELSHKLNYTEDMKNYNRSNINAPENIAIELRANMFAWQNMTGENINQGNKYGNTTFSTSKDTNYPTRTRENAEWSDITLALATDFNTAGERLTKNAAKDKYVSYQLSKLANKAEDIANDLYNQIQFKGKTKDIKLNIAGNGIYSLNKEQYYYNNLLTEVLQKLLDKGITISSIRSGGQTGIDEAGIIAAQRLNIPNEVHTTSNFAFRIKSNEDIKDNEQAFKSRFIFNPLGQEGHMTYEDVMNLFDSRKTYKGMITSLQPNQIFVFGSNTEGRHGAGAAKTAKDKFGAKYGQAEGPQGQSYAIITKDLTKDDKKHPSRTKEQIIEQIHKLYEYAKANPNKEFLVAYSSTGRNLNYYTNQEMAEMFANEEIPSNIVFEEGFNELVNNIDNTINWARTAENSYEVSTRGDKRFSALNATFKKGTIIDGVDVGGMTIEDVYQKVIKKSGKGQVPSKDSKLYIETPKSNPFNISSVEESKRKQFAENTGISIDHIESPTDKDIEDYRFTEIVVVTSKGDRIQLAPKAGFQDLNNVVKVSDIKGLIGINYLLENYLQKHPSEVNKFGDSVLSSYAKDVYGDKYDATKDNFQGEYSSYIKAISLSNKSKEEREDFSYTEGYLPLWQEWAKQNPELMNELRIKSYGKTLTDQYTNTRVSQARALADILNESPSIFTPSRQQTNQQSKVETLKQETRKEDLPIIGTPNYDTELKVDKESPRAILSRELTPKQIFDRENLIAREFSNVVGQFLEDTIEETRELLETTDDNLLKLQLSNKLNDLNSENGRSVVMQEVGFEAINDEIKARFQDWIDMSDEDYQSVTGSSEKADYIREQYQKALDNYDTLFNDAIVIIENNESIRLVETEVEDENGEKVHGNEGYTFKIRFVDAHDSCRGVTRRALSDIKQVDSNGNPVLDDLANPSYLREDFVHSTLLGFLAKEVITPDDFVLYDRKNDEYTFPALEKLQEKFPWVNQIINKLAYDPNLISAFYTDFRKEFISYWSQFDGKTTRLNTPVEIDSTINNLISNYESGNKQDDNSVYNTDLSINKENVEKGKVLANKIIKDLQKADNEDLVDISNEIMKLLRMLGFSDHNISKEIFLNEDNKTITRNVISFTKDILDKLSTLKEGSHYADTYGTQIENIARLIGKATELDATTTFREMGNDYPSYTAPNELEITFKKLKDSRYREKFLEEQFKRYDWFCPIINKETGEKDWSNEVLRLIETDSNIRDNMELKNVFMLEKQEYSDWNKPLISSAFVREYFYTKEDPQQTHNFGFFNFPIFSDTQMATFIKFKKYTGDYKQSLAPLFRKLVKQELRRMKLVEERNKLGIPKISSFDNRGAKFCFLPELNDIEVTVDGEKRNLLDTIKYYSQDDYKRPDKVDEAISLAIYKVMENKFKEFLENNPSLLKDESLIEFIKKNSIMEKGQNVVNKLEEYFWNQTFMTSQLIQILTTDLAFYKNSVDFQKRFKEVYAAGTRLNTNSPYGRKVEKTVYISDDIMTSPTYKPLKKLLYEAYQEGKISKMDYDSILHKFKDINATDGQAYRSLSSYRAIMDMLGLWNEDLEATFDRLKSGEWDMGDINAIFQTIKPFVFGHVNTPNGLGDFMKVPHQNKNSEFLLLATYQVLGTTLTKSEQLRALNDFMENNNIDVIQFESAVKVGGSGIININVNHRKLKDAVTNKKIKVNNKEYSISEDIKLGDITKTFEKVKEYFDSLLDKDSITQEEYTDVMEYFKPNYRETLDTLTKYTKTKVRETDVLDDEGFNLTSVHKLSYESYMIAQPTPEHVFDVESIFGSQFRNLIASDLPEDIEIEIEGTKIKGKDNVRKFYFSLIVENLLESYKEVADDFSNIESLQERLLSIVKGNPKYGRDMINALELVEYNGRKVFNMPFNDRMIAAKFEELMTSVFKNNITKQYINGASCIAVSNFGFTNELQVERNEDGSVKAIECYLPATSKKLYEPYLKEIIRNGHILGYEIDYNKIKKEDESLLEIIGFRIPTEAKYSMLPLRIKGFLPQQNGSAIMLPAEVTTLSGMDYDVDKVFLFLPSFKLENKYDVKKAWDDFYNDSNNIDIKYEINSNVQLALEHYIKNNPEDSDVNFKEYLEFLKDKNIKLYQLSEVIDKENNITKAQQRFTKWFDTRKNNYFISKKIKRIKYDTSKEPKDNSKAQRDNAIIQLSLGILRNKEVGIASQTPGNFDTLKSTSRVSEIYTNKQYLAKYIKEYKLIDMKETIEHLLNNNLDKLDKFMKKNRVEDNPLTLDTFMKYHYQNMTGGTLIGIYANNTTMQAKLQGKNLRLKDDFTFTIDGKLIKNLTDVYTEELVNGKIIKKRISQNCAEFSAASVDNVKDPVLASLLQNKDTASIACFMLRAGLSIPQIGALFNLPLVSESIRNYGNLKPLNKICENIEKEVAKLKGISKYKSSVITDFNTIDMIALTILYNNIGLLDNNQKIELYEKILGFARGFQFIAGISEYLNETVRAYRADSPNGAIAISLAKAKAQTLRLNDILIKSNRVDYPLEGVENILVNNYLSLNDSIDEMREKLMSSEMPMLQAFYSLGIDLGLKTLSPYFANTSEKANQIIDFIQSNRLRPLKDTDINNIYEAINLFGLSDTNLFGNDNNMSMEEKYVYYIKQFPRDFASIISSNPDIKALPFIQKLVSGVNGIEMRNSARNTSYLRELLTNSADSLLYLDNPEAHKLAVGLLRYAYYKEKIKYGPHTFNQFFSTIFKNGFPEYIETLRELENSMETNSKWDRLLDQIYSNNSYLATEVSLDEKTKTITEDSKLIITSKNEVRNPNYMAYQPLDYITNDGILYKLNRELTDESTIYYDKLETSRKEFYNMNNEVNDSVNKLMLYEESYKQKITEDNKKAIITSPKDRESDNTETGNIMKGNKADELFAGKEQEWNLNALDAFMEQANARAKLKQQEEKYSSSEGLKEMDEKPCKVTIPKDAISLRSM